MRIVSIRSLLTGVFLFLATSACFAEAVLQKVNTILFVVAMDKEAQPIIEKLHLTPMHTSFSGLPMQVYSGKNRQLNIYLIMNGQDPMYKVQNVASQAATLSTYLGVEHFHPDLIISVGTAGGMKKQGAEVRNVYLSQKVYFYDRRIPDTKDYAAYGMGGYLSAQLPAKLIQRAQLKLGIACTGDSFDNDPIDHEVMQRTKCQTIDMEAAGAAWVSMLTKTPFIALKGVTDYVEQNENSVGEYEKNISWVTNDLADKTQAIVAFYAGQG